MTDPETLILDEVSDANGDPVPNSAVSFIPQSIINDGQHWLDKGEFELSIKTR